MGLGGRAGHKITSERSPARFWEGQEEGASDAFFGRLPRRWHAGGLGKGVGSLSQCVLCSSGLPLTAQGHRNMSRPQEAQAQPWLGGFSRWRKRMGLGSLMAVAAGNLVRLTTKTLRLCTNDMSFSAHLAVVTAPKCNMGAALRKDAPNMCGRTKSRVVLQFSLIFAFPRHPWNALNPSHHHQNLTRQPLSVTYLFASTPPPDNRQQRQGDQFGGTEFFDGDKANVAANWGSLSTAQRKVTKPLADRATRPTTDRPTEPRISKTVCQLSTLVPWPQNEATWRWTKEGGDG